MTVKPVEIFVILLAFVIAFVLLRVFKRDTLADKKRQDIEMKRAAIIAKRKAAAQAENNPDASMDDN